MKPTVIPIQHFLPHQEPMLLVDYIYELNAEEVTTHFLIHKEHIFVAENQLQEAGLIENAAQTCSCILGQKFYDTDEDHQHPKAVGYISSIKTFQINSLPQVDEILITKAILISKNSMQDFDMCTLKVESFVHDKLIAFGEINLILRSYTN